MRAAIYCRVSTQDQIINNQLRELKQVAKRKGWQVVATFTDEGISGAKGRDLRPGFDKLLKGATRREFDLVACWSVDRLGRSLQHLIEALNELHGAGCDLYLHQQAVDTQTPAGRALFGMLGVFAEFERSIIRERVRAGVARAKASGTKFGRKSIIDDALTKRVLELRQQGKGIHPIRIALKIGAGTVQRILKEARA